MPPSLEYSTDQSDCSTESFRKSSPTFPETIIFASPLQSSTGPTPPPKTEKTVTFLDDATPRTSSILPTPDNPHSLLSYSELPEWAQDNPHIHNHYRSISSSTPACFASWFYMHNESVNIYSHIIGALIFILLEGLIYHYLSSNYPLATVRDHLIFAYFLASATACMLLSTLYHTFWCHSQRFRQLWLKFDFAGILVLILAVFVTAVFMCFYCEHRLQWIYWGVVSLPFFWFEDVANEGINLDTRSISPNNGHPPSPPTLRS